jgi:hypothetical protein
MPRYLFETRRMSDCDREGVVRLMAERFPEIGLEHRYSVRADVDSRDVWVCRASNEAHLRRWASAAGLDIDVLRRVDAADTPHVRPTEATR